MKLTKVYVFALLIVLGSCSPIDRNSNTEEDFTLQNGVVYSKENIPQTPRWFADSRLAFQMDDEGVNEIGYYVEGGGTIFKQNLWHGFRYYLEKDGLNYAPEFKNNKVWPFGVESEWQLFDSKFTHKIMSIDERLIFEITTPEDLKDDYKFRFDFNTTYGFSYGDVNDYRYQSSPNRQWKAWQFDEAENVLKGGYINKKVAPKHVASEVIGLGPASFTQEGTEETGNDADVPGKSIACAIGADFDITYANRKMIPTLISPTLEAGKTYRIIVNFGANEKEALAKNKDIIVTAKEKTEQQFERYTALGEQLPKLTSPYKSLDRLFELMPMYHEAMKIVDVPGAIRAKTWYYWVWGWDGMTMNNATAYWGDSDFVKELLGFYYQTSSPDLGIAHMFNYDFTIAEYSPLPAQSMYIVLLQMYYDNTNDIEAVKKYFPFAKKLYDMNLKDQVGETGMIKGTSLFPDFRNLVGETGNDISAFNNSIFYSASRSFNRLAAIVGDEDAQKTSKEIISRIEDNFIDKVFNKEQGYLSSSIDATTFEPRDVYQTSSMRWENNYYYDLVSPVLEPSMDFYAKNFVSKAGLRIIPKWNKAYGADDNQLFDWWPINDEQFTRLSNLTDRKDLIEKWIGWVSYWGDMLTVPESVGTDVETDKPKPDNWDSLKGSWQAFSIRPWYQGIIHGVVGVDADAGGITFYPYSGEEMTLENFHYQGKTFDFDMKGSGSYIESIKVGDKLIKGTNKLPLECYANEDHVDLIVTRTAKRLYDVNIKQGMGILVKDYSYKNGAIRTNITGAGISKLILQADRKPVVMLDGKKIDVVYNSNVNQAVMEIDLVAGKDYALTVE